ncbi:MAG: TetR/AcrR family transcriptional regulator [Geminicoccaceae bacterium]
MATIHPATNERRQRILAAAGDLFAREAYAVVQMDDIARAARVAKPTLYRHFGTKEALFAEAVAQSLGALEREARRIADGDGPAVARFRLLVAEMRVRIGRLKALVREAEGNGSHPGGRGRATIRRELRGLRQVIARVIADGIVEGSIAPVDPELAARIVLGAVRMTSDAGETEAAGSVADLLLTGLAGHRSPKQQS